LELDLPVLGLCYGHQLIAQVLGGTIERSTSREYGSATMQVTSSCALFEGLEATQQIWMSHGDSVAELPQGFELVASTADCPVAAVCNPARKIYGLQFHPEVTDTPNGMQMLDNFLSICGCQREWNAERFLEDIEHEVKTQCNGRKVFLLVSGGVDSSVAFMLLNKVLGPQHVRGLHIDNGLMRLGESDDIMAYMKAHGFDNLDIVDASQTFLDALHAEVEPERKREIIGNTFIQVQEQALTDMGLNSQDWILGQGTIYPDTIESAGTKHADKIKTHHNRVDKIVELIEQGLVIEPLAQLYKDEVRALGEALGLPRQLVWRHPFPGPGLGVRTLCSDGTLAPLDAAAQQQVSMLAAEYGYTATILPVRSVGVQGDGRTYAHPVLLQGPQDWSRMEELSTRLTNSVPSVNRVVYAVHIQGDAQYRPVQAYVTRDRLTVLRAIDDEATRLLYRFEQYDAVWQMPVVILPLVNGQGGQCIVIRPIVSKEAMTARFIPLKQEIIEGLRAAAGNIEGAGDIFMDITHKPPATIEWE
jgi:GMP synthase (glutamine-hydrolysing)